MQPIVEILSKRAQALGMNSGRRLVCMVLQPAHRWVASTSAAPSTATSWQIRSESSQPCTNGLLASLATTQQLQQRRNYNCWSCKRLLSERETRTALCPCDEQRILPVDVRNSYFDLFGIPVHYDIDKSMLTSRFRQLMRKLHPDLFTMRSEFEQRCSAEQSSLINKAYRILFSPIERGLYMLELKRVSLEAEAADDETRSEILTHVMELNELIDDIETAAQVEELAAKLSEFIAPLKVEVSAAFKERDFRRAARAVAKMRYYKNVDERLKDLRLQFNLHGGEPTGP